MERALRTGQAKYLRRPGPLPCSYAQLLVLMDTCAQVTAVIVDNEIKLNEKDAVHIRRFCAVCKGSCSTVILQVRNDALRAFLAAADSAKLSCETRRRGRRIG